MHVNFGTPYVNPHVPSANSWCLMCESSEYVPHLGMRIVDKRFAKLADRCFAAVNRVCDLIRLLFEYARYVFSNVRTCDVTPFSSCNLSWRIAPHVFHIWICAGAQEEECTLLVFVNAC